MKLFFQLLAIGGSAKVDQEKRMQLFVQASQEEQALAKSLLEAFTMHMHSITIRANTLAGRGEEVLLLLRKQPQVQAAEQMNQQAPETGYQSLLEEMKQVGSVETFLNNLEQDIDSILNAL
jgi:hypothetical protein